ncbi:unknown protein [Cronobacter turicensis z3032]|uniref:Uncharacterized protein n=1 Tax=Cronobacter turicensis (strain DSM 18703 / CCUG 55852 / LMG 23827 / z3032) TaxID=693216 RepID=C9XUW4_CROTZ|nr:unknown protein [Cronobacter turicensis z3032]
MKIKKVSCVILFFYRFRRFRPLKNPGAARVITPRSLFAASLILLLLRKSCKINRLP